MEDHAVTITLFATDCLRAMPLLMSQLETTLAPDTGDLSLRVGIHSGAVTSGVLRGDKGRFQLFGDTINTASRMESTGQANKIQLSPDTADILRNKKGFEEWLSPRQVKVFVKDQGHLQTYWFMKGHQTAIAKSATSVDSDEYLASILQGKEDPYKKKSGRLVRWNVEEITKLLNQGGCSKKARE
jgi:hypothetical protein